jgi:hypothetical protein
LLFVTLLIRVESHLNIRHCRPAIVLGTNSAMAAFSVLPGIPVAVKSGLHGVDIC